MQMTGRSGYLAAWQDRRRRMAVLKAIQFSFFLIPMTGWVTSSKYPTVYQRWGRQVLLAFPAWFLAYIAAGVWLNRFRCPGCGKLYYWILQWKGLWRGRGIGVIATTAASRRIRSPVRVSAKLERFESRLTTIVLD
jgi:hypothetical protein